MTVAEAMREAAIIAAIEKAIAEAEAVADDEREACAKIADYYAAHSQTARQIAAAIRARAKTKRK